MFGRKAEKPGKAGALLVPSDVTILEHRFAVGKRKLKPAERIGLWTVLPLWRRNYVRMSRAEYKAVLTKHYPSAEVEDLANDDRHLLEIVRTRQEHVRRLMVCRSWGLFGLVAAPLVTWFGFRHYDKKGQLIPLPFMAYGGNLVGRATSAWLTGRWESPLRDVSLGNLPAKTFFKPPSYISNP